MAENTQDNKPRIELTCTENGGVSKAIMRMQTAPGKELVFTYSPRVSSASSDNNSIDYNCKVQEVSTKSILGVFPKSKTLLKYERRFAETIRHKPTAEDIVLNPKELLDRPFNPADPEGFEVYFNIRPDGTASAGDDSVFVTFPKKGDLSARLMNLEKAVREAISAKITEEQEKNKMTAHYNQMDTVFKLGRVKAYLDGYVKGIDVALPPTLHGAIGPLPLTPGMQASGHATNSKVLEEIRKRIADKNGASSKKLTDISYEEYMDTLTHETQHRIAKSNRLHKKKEEPTAEDKRKQRQEKGRAMYENWKKQHSTGKDDK